MSKVTERIKTIIATMPWAKGYEDLDILTQFKKITGITWVTEEMLEDEAMQDKLMWMVVEGAAFNEGDDLHDGGNDDGDQDDPEPEPEPQDPEEYAAEVLGQIKGKDGDVTLTQDLELADQSLTLTKKNKIDLGGNAINVEKGGTYGDTCVIGNGATVTLKNGDINPAGNSSLANQSATILVKTASASTVVLEDVKVTGIYPVYLNSANEGSTVTINGGEYYSEYQDNPAVYVGKGSTGSTIGGKVTINGGTFGQKGVHPGFLLNVEDVLRKQEGKEPRNFIEVKGGKYINFDPSNNKAEGEGTNFVAEGYKVTSENDGDDIIYTVSKA